MDRVIREFSRFSFDFFAQILSYLVSQSKDITFLNHLYLNFLKKLTKINKIYL